MENYCFGKEIKALNILKNPEYDFEMFLEAPISKTRVIELRHKVKEIINQYGSEMGKSIRFITSKLVEARELNEGKLIKLMPERQNREPSSGIIIYKMPQTNMVCTSFWYQDLTQSTPDPDRKTVSGNTEISFIHFVNDLLFYTFTTIGYNNDQEFSDCYNHDGTFLSTQKSGRMLWRDAMDIAYEFDWLLKHMDVEVKNLPAKSKIDAFGCKYTNLTTNNIQIIDSKWFTTLVKSDAFKVRGHFRLQPCGEGMKDRKLIWINDFEKSGYTAPARKLKHEE